MGAKSLVERGGSKLLGLSRIFPESLLIVSRQLVFRLRIESFKLG